MSQALLYPRRPAATRCVVAASAVLALGVPSTPARADLAVPAWYDQNAVGTAPDWHYRVAVTTPANTDINSTVVVNVDFAALLASLGASGTFDANSPRVVRPNGSLAATQEFTDTIFSGVTDAAGNARGEVRFLAQEASAQTYYIYFDITANGVKAVNPQQPINGNFERGATGTATPTGWIAPTKTNGAFDAQVRPSETVSVTTDGTGTPPTVNTDGTPRTGLFSYLIGSRTANEPAIGNPAVTFTRTIAVPATNPGNLTVRYRVEGWHSSADGQAFWDFLRITLVGGSSTEIVGPTAGNYVTFPYAPNLGIGPAFIFGSGYGQYNGWDTDTTGTHRSGMTIARGSEPWFTRTVSLAAYAGQTITLHFTSSHFTSLRTWFHIDDVEWSVVNGTVGAASAFGANIQLPTAATFLVPGNVVAIRAQVDAIPAAPTNPVTANIYRQGGALAVSGVILYNDGTHGDAIAGDAIWTNDGSVPANPTYTVQGGDPQGTGWLVRLFAKDASTSIVGAQNGLLLRAGQPASPESQANFHNVDDQAFEVRTPILTLAKVSVPLIDPVRGSVNPLNIPGAEILYGVSVSNAGGAGTDAGTVAVSDILPAEIELFVGDIGGPGSGPVQFINGTPPSGLTYSFISLSSVTDSLDFSNNGGATWTYIPTGSYDPAVNAVRVRPSGSLAGSTGSGNPSFTLLFVARIK